eukprot:scaffold293416_cov32-Tisochrysis_lutea.AAC.1
MLTILGWQSLAVKYDDYVHAMGSEQVCHPAAVLDVPRRWLAGHELQRARVSATVEPHVAVDSDALALHLRERGRLAHLAQEGGEAGDPHGPPQRRSPTG